MADLQRTRGLSALKGCDLNQWVWISEVQTRARHGLEQHCLHDGTDPNQPLLLCASIWLFELDPRTVQPILHDQVDKTVPWKVIPLLEDLDGLIMGSGNPSFIFEYQRRQLEEKAPDLASCFYQVVEATTDQA
uniref:Uncharacterized protein n=1 Tax=Salvator merianae TaxID=96440 RepID=A0A8D0BUI1_SALMN